MPDVTSNRNARDLPAAAGHAPTLRVLEISPYEPPASGWVTRIKLLRRLIEGRGGRCEILDIGPSRRMERPGCLPVTGAIDYLVKVTRFARAGFTIHGHVNAEYFRGLLLCLAAEVLARLFRTRSVVTFHGGPLQAYLAGWRRLALAPLFRTIFHLADATVCNSETVKRTLVAYGRPGKIHVIPAFSVQYLSFTAVALDAGLKQFLASRAPILSTYVCFRDGFFIDLLVDALQPVAANWPDLGFVVVGTGPERERFERAVADRGLDRHVCLAGDLGHDAFMTLLGETDVHLRTPVTDGVSATVLEALSLRVPVVASENGARPAGVVLYPAEDAAAMAKALDGALRRRDQLAAGLPPLHIEDTGSLEVDLLQPAGRSHDRSGIAGGPRASRQADPRPLAARTQLQ